MGYRYLYTMVILSFVFCSNAWSFEQTDKSPLNKRFTIYGGARVYQADGTFSSTRQGSPAVAVNMNDLDLDQNKVSPVGGFKLNFGKRWNLHFDYFGYHDDAQRTIGRNFNFDGINFPVSATAISSLDIDLYVLNLSYNIIHTGKARFGLGIGVHGIDFDLQISGRVLVGGNEVTIGEGEEDFIVPIPNLWAHGAYAFTESVILRYGAGWMSAGYDDYNGSLYLASAAIEYWPFKNTGFGLGYHYISADIDYESRNRTENYDVDLPGVIFYITFGF